MPETRRLLLAGGGHVHVQALQALVRRPGPDGDVVMVTPSRFPIYSGMLPGWMAGHYTLAQCRLDLAPLAAAAGVELVLDRIDAMNAGDRSVSLASGRRMGFELLSLDVGSEIQVAALKGAGAALLPVRPLETFVAQWPRILAAARAGSCRRLVVAGGGAAGVELAFAARHALRIDGLEVAVELVAAEEGVMPEHARGARRRVERLLKRRGIPVHRSPATGVPEGLCLASGERLKADWVVAATGARPPAWLASSGLALDSQGFVLVDEHQRSTSHRSVFAAGDVAARKDVPMTRSGVNAVRAGPVVGDNLVAVLQGKELQAFRPRQRTLFLLSTGPRHAIGVWGRWSLQGRWVWWLKNWIDRRYIRRHGGPAESAPPPGDDAGAGSTGRVA